MIKIKDMKTGYGDEVSFIFPDITLEKGKITTIIGKNGSGKSTLLKSIAGIIPYSGSLRVNDIEIMNLAPRERAKLVAYLPQNLKSVNIDVETLVEHGRYPWHGSMRRLSVKDRRIIDEALNITDMTNLKSKSLSELSGGERQRAYLAMVIAQDTPMILLDEPTTFMDIKVQQKFLSIIENLKNSGRGIAAVLHNIEQSFAISDFIYVLDDRKVASYGTPDELIKEEGLLRKIFGVTLRKSEDPSLLYPYETIK
ncbi:MAG: ABC transporter ATP-binding protein [Lachnospiraceae bacterium]|nr:ABC transporter ATP-binding protein [Lachnospiraceae bacterium]